MDDTIWKLRLVFSTLWWVTGANLIWGCYRAIINSSLKCGQPALTLKVLEVMDHHSTTPDENCFGHAYCLLDRIEVKQLIENPRDKTPQHLEEGRGLPPSLAPTYTLTVCRTSMPTASYRPSPGARVMWKSAFDAFAQVKNVASSALLVPLPARALLVGYPRGRCLCGAP